MRAGLRGEASWFENKSNLEGSMETALTVAKWYERERWPYAEDRYAIDKFASWLSKVDWKFFCTLTFAWRVSDQQAENVFTAFIIRLESHLRCEVCFIRGDEKRFSGCGKSASGRHFHVLLTCIAPVNAEFIASLWKSMAGNRSDDAGALVEEYSASENGTSYVLKCINQPEGSWNFRHLELFQPEARASQTVNARWRRRQGRFEKRRKQIAN
jgi:hypothetical protein